MTPYLLWDDKETRISSLEALDNLLDHLTVEAKQLMPFTVELHVNNDTGLLIVLGQTESPVEWYSAADRFPIMGAHGPWDDDNLLVFLHHGHYSELPKRFCVPIADAREALRQYFLTGVRPSNIHWNDPFHK